MNLVIKPTYKTSFGRGLDLLAKGLPSDQTKLVP